MTNTLIGVLVGWGLGVLSSIIVPLVLEWWRRPRLVLQTGRDEPFTRLTELTGGKLAEWSRVKVTNKGRTSALNCIPMLFSVTTNSELRNDVDPIALRWAGIPRLKSFDPINLGPGDVAYFNVLRTTENENVARFESYDYPELDTGFRMGLPLEYTHELTVMVTSSTGNPVRQSYVFTRTEPLLREH